MVVMSAPFTITQATPGLPLLGFAPSTQAPVETIFGRVFPHFSVWFGKLEAVAISGALQSLCECAHFAWKSLLRLRQFQHSFVGNERVEVALR